MHIDEFRPLLCEGESQDLEWKKDWPQGLLRGSSDPTWKDGRGVFLKDLVSLANSTGSSTAYLVYGVEDSGGSRKIFGISKSFDDADFQQWATNTFDPPPKFVYTPIEWSKNVNIGVFSIERIPRFPHVVKSKVGGILYVGQVWFRKGTQNNIALHTELLMMLKGEEPYRISKLNDPILEEVKCHYKDKKRDVSLPLIGRKDSLLSQGYNIATYPGTRREIWVGQQGNRYEHILLLKPKK